MSFGFSKTRPKVKIIRSNFRQNVDFWFTRGIALLIEIIPLNDELTKDKFLIANLDAAGFYRVNYDEESWRKISKQLLNHKEVSRVSWKLLE